MRLRQYLRTAPPRRYAGSTLGMSYLSRAPTYVYELPCCGAEFRSRTESLPDDGDGQHWFYCQECDAPCCVPPGYLEDGRPYYPSGRRMGDYQVSVLADSAIVRDRIARHYRTVWNAESIRHIARLLGVPQEQVEYVARDLGVYDSAAKDLGDIYR